MNENKEVSGSLEPIIIGPDREHLVGLRRLWDRRVDGQPGTWVTVWRILIGWSSLKVFAGFRGEERTANQGLGRLYDAPRLARMARMVSVS